MNLLSNAIKYTPEGGKISLKISEQYSPNPKKASMSLSVLITELGYLKGFHPRYLILLLGPRITRSVRCRGLALEWRLQKI